MSALKQKSPLVPEVCKRFMQSTSYIKEGIVTSHYYHKWIEDGKAQESLLQEKQGVKHGNDPYEKPSEETLSKPIRL